MCISDKLISSFYQVLLEGVKVLSRKQNTIGLLGGRKDDISQTLTQKSWVALLATNRMNRSHPAVREMKLRLEDLSCLVASSNVTISSDMVFAKGAKEMSLIGNHSKSSRSNAYLC